METLEGSASEAEEQPARERTNPHLQRLLQIEIEHIGRVDAGGGAMGAQKLVEIATLRDDAALALTDLREVGVRRVAVAEPDSLGWR